MKIFEMVTEFFMKGYKSNAMNDIAQLVSSAAGAEYCDVLLYEKHKDQFRIVGTNGDKEKVASVKIDAKSLHDYPNVVKLTYQDQLLGALILKKPVNMDLQGIVDELSLSLFWANKFIELKNIAERYHSMSELTDVFYDSVDKEQFNAKMVKVIARILNADTVIFFERQEEEYVFFFGIWYHQRSVAFRKNQAYPSFFQQGGEV